MKKMKTLKITLAFLTLLFFSNIATAQRSDGTSEYNDVDNVLTVSGEITEVNHPIAKMKGDDGNEYQIHMGADRGRRSCVYKHTVHGYIPAAGDEIILTMDEIHPKIYRETHDYPSVACCHTVSPNDQFSWTS